MDDLEKIKNEIEKGSPERPDSLSRKNITEMLNGKNSVPVAVEKKYTVRRLAYAAAALVVTVAALTAVYFGRDMDKPILQNETTSSVSQQTEQTTFNEQTNEDSYKEIEDYFLSLGEKITLYNDVSYKSAAMAVTEAAAETKTKSFNAADDMVEEGESTRAYNSFGKTNTQVEGVDEADVIKNDGRYIYTVTDRCTVNIIDTENMKTASTIEIKEESEDTILSVSQMYLNADRLILICTGSKSYESELDYSEEEIKEKMTNVYRWYEPSEAVCLVYDVSDRTSPVLLNTFRQDGQPVSSRMVGSILYNISLYSVDIGEDRENLKKKCIPTVNGVRVAADTIKWVKDDNQDTSTYIVITACDTASVDGAVNSKSMLGAVKDVYCTDSSLFISQYMWKEDRTYTKIHSFTLNGMNISYNSSGSVPGEPLNQFSLDEYKGYFRIATTSFDYESFIDVSSVYVLDANMKIVGRLENLKYDESIRSVRFMGDTAYVVTFLNTDPLFVIDMSNPASPQVKGEVKLPGFSAYLHPVGNGLMAGVGYDGDDSGADFCTVKVSLFDVKNPEKPYEINNVTIDCASTDIDYDHKAFMYYPELGYIGIPVRVDKEDKPVNSYMVLKVTDKGLELLSGFVHQSGDDVWSNTYFRGTYIGNNLFTVSNRLIKRFSLDSFENTGSLELQTLAKQKDELYQVVY